MTAPYTGLDQETRICAHCGYCQAVCPVYDALGWESSGPRGRMTAAHSIAGRKPADAQASRRIYECTLCGACREVCPTRIDTVAAWLETRKRLAEAGALEELPLGRLRDNLAATHNVTGDAPENRLLLQENLEPIVKPVSERKHPERSGASFCGAQSKDATLHDARSASFDCVRHTTPNSAQDAPLRSEPSDLALNGRRGAAIIYFVGCVTGLYPQGHPIAQAMTELLTRAGADSTTLGDEESCCGFPYLGLGLHAEAAQVAAHNVAAAIALGAQKIVTTCPSCYHVWRDVYPELLGEPLNLEVLHASELLARWVTSGAIELTPLDERITYHDPCDLGRNSGVYDAPRRLLQAIPGVELVEMADHRENALCCGGGGNLEAVNPELAATIAARRLAQALETGARTLVTPCQQCKRTLANAARRAKARLKVLDLTEYLVRALP